MATYAKKYEIENILDLIDDARTWANIEKPEWTNQFDWGNVGPFIMPPQTTNYEVITNNSITPVSHQAYYLGQRLRRYYFVHS